MKKKIISILLAFVMVLCLVPAAMAEEKPFTASVGETSLTAVSKTENAYTYHGWTGDETVDVYTVTIPDAATEISLHLHTPSLAYNYKGDGVTYLAGEYDMTPETGSMYTGVTEVIVPTDANGDGVLDYVQVQTPYDASYNSAVRYAITFRYANAGAGSSTTAIGASVQNTYSLTRSLLSGRKVNYTWAGGTSNSDDWDVFGLARDGVSIPKSYINSVKAFAPTAGTYISDCARAILVLNACGEEVSDTLLSAVTDESGLMGSNDVIFALLALDSKNYTAPADGISREKLIDRILSLQQSDNAWGYSYVSGTDWTTPWGTDVDTTAQAITALAPYYTTNIKVKTAVDKALAWLKTRQLADGTFGYMDSASVESTSQVIVALTALGIDPADWNGKNAVSGMCSMAVSAGGFTYSGSFNEISTYEGYYALVAYYRFHNGQAALYDMSHADPVKPTPEKPDAPDTSEAPAVSSAKTADAGILLYGALSVSALMGMGYVGKKSH